VPRDPSAPGPGGAYSDGAGGPTLRSASDADTPDRDAGTPRSAGAWWRTAAACMVGSSMPLRSAVMGLRRSADNIRLRSLSLSAACVYISYDFVIQISSWYFFLTIYFFKSPPF
jgi:hypothetical protein